LKTSQVTVTTTPTKIVSKGSVSYREIHFHNESGNIYIGGDNTVSTTNGVKVDNNSHDVMHLPGSAEIWAVTAANTGVVYVLQVNE
jgi:hypothetical protein